MTVNEPGIQPDRITLDYHRKYPEISLERHFRSKFLTTADRALARKRIYLDTRFWVLLREVCLGRSTIHSTRKYSHSYGGWLLKER